MRVIGHRRSWRAASSWLLAAGLTASITWLGAPLLAQEQGLLEIPPNLSTEEADALLEGLAPDEVRELCREEPSLESTAPCREALEGSESKGGGTSEDPPASSPESPHTFEAAGSSAAPAAAPRAGARGQTSRPRVSVDKRNDANGDGTYTSDEVAPRPGAAVSFRVRITNLGRSAVRIERIVDSYRETHEEVCGDLRGQRIRPSTSKTCIFVLPNYAPPRFDSVANTVDVRVNETSTGRRTTGSDISTVTTLRGGENQVLGESTTRPSAGGQGEMASTGFDLLPPISLAMLLLASGTGLVRLGEVRMHTRRQFREKKKRAGKSPPAL
jgi:hypothetical protein